MRISKGEFIRTRYFTGPINRKAESLENIQLKQLMIILYD